MCFQKSGYHTERNRYGSNNQPTGGFHHHDGKKYLHIQEKKENSITFLQLDDSTLRFQITLKQQEADSTQN